MMKFQIYLWLALTILRPTVLKCSLRFRLANQRKEIKKQLFITRSEQKNKYAYLIISSKTSLVGAIQSRTVPQKSLPQRTFPRRTAFRIHFPDEQFSQWNISQTGISLTNCSHNDIFPNGQISRRALPQITYFLSGMQRSLI